MALDISDGYKTVQKKISATQKYQQVDKDIQDLKKKKGESLEIYKKEVSEQLSSAKKKVDKFENTIRDKKNQLDQLYSYNKILIISLPTNYFHLSYKFSNNKNPKINI